MKINPTNAATTTEAIKRTVEKLEVPANKNPKLNMSPAAVNRTYEMSKDPAVTVLKFTNSVTHEVELQVPSEASLRIYKDMQKFMDQHAPAPAKTDSVNIIV